jgi:hypothetical protein
LICGRCRASKRRTASDRCRTSDGRKRARARGVLFGRPPMLTLHQRREAIFRREAGETLTDIASATTLVTQRSTACDRLPLGGGSKLGRGLFRARRRVKPASGSVTLSLNPCPPLLFARSAFRRERVRSMARSFRRQHWAATEAIGPKADLYKVLFLSGRQSGFAPDHDTRYPAARKVFGG